MLDVLSQCTAQMVLVEHDLVLPSHAYLQELKLEGKEQDDGTEPIR